MTPWLIGFAMLGFLGNSQMMEVAGKENVEVRYQNAAFVWIPVMIVIGVAWFMLVGSDQGQHQAAVRHLQQPGHLRMTILHHDVRHSSGLAAQFGLLTSNLYGSGNPAIVEGAGATAKLLVRATTRRSGEVRLLGPLSVRGARCCLSPLTDRMGGAIWT